MEGDWGHNSIMLTGNSNGIMCSFIYHYYMLCHFRLIYIVVLLITCHILIGAYIQCALANHSYLHLLSFVSMLNSIVN